MLKVSCDRRVSYALDFLPFAIKEEIGRIGRGRTGGLSSIREISLRAKGRSTLSLVDEVVPLMTSLTSSEIENIVVGLSDGALYAHRDSIASGFITVRYGIRVGICGYAGYEEDKLVGISNIRSLLFRIPSGECAFGEELQSAYYEGVGAGMLIYSPPGVGKTTALRKLAEIIGGGREGKRVAVIDERCEFCDDDYIYAQVDILKGYKRKRGIEIATRTMSPSVIMIDEIGGDDALDIMSVIRCGIPLIATAHAGDYDELMAKPSLAPLISAGAFDLFFGISKNEQGYSICINRR